MYNFMSSRGVCTRACRKIFLISSKAPAQPANTFDLSRSIKLIRSNLERQLALFFVSNVFFLCVCCWGTLLNKRTRFVVPQRRCSQTILWNKQVARPEFVFCFVDNQYILRFYSVTYLDQFRVNTVARRSQSYANFSDIWPCHFLSSVTRMSIFLNVVPASVFERRTDVKQKNKILHLSTETDKLSQMIN